MISRKQIVCTAGFLLLSTGLAAAAPARVATDLNVRSGEGTGYPVVAVMPAGEVVEVSGCGDGWCFVRDYGGFASSSYLDVAGAAYVAPSTTYVAPPAVVVSPRIYDRRYYDRPYYSDRGNFVRRGVRQLRREFRQDRRQDRRETRQELRQERRETRQDRRQETRQDRRQGARQEARQDRRDARAQSR